MSAALTDADAFWVVSPGHGEIRPEPFASPRRGEVAVDAVFSGISRGTEALVFSGKVPPNQYQLMRCPFQTGDFPGPVKYGYASVGRTRDTNKRVFCLFPHQTHYVVPQDAVIEIPDNVSDERAALGANMETAVNGMWDARPCVGDKVAVIGAGVVGCFLAVLLRQIPGISVQLVDINPAKAEIAAALGVDFAHPDDARSGLDLVFHVSGAPAGLTTALGLAGFEAEVWEMSWYGNAAVAAPLGQNFHSKRLSLRSSQVGAVAPSRRPRRTRRDRLTFALSLLHDARFDALITGRSPFRALPETMAQLAHNPGNTLCHLVAY